MRTRRFNRYIPDDGVVVDFGCGENIYFLKSIKDKIKLGIGIDNKYQYDIDYYRNIITLNELSHIEDNSVDLFVMIAVLEHLQYPIKTLINAYRILKTGKKIVLTTPTPASKPILEFLAWTGIINKEEIDDHKHYYSKEELIWLLSTVGFKDIKHKYFQFGLMRLSLMQN